MVAQLTQSESVFCIISVDEAFCRTSEYSTAEVLAGRAPPDLAKNEGRNQLRALDDGTDGER